MVGRNRLDVRELLLLCSVALSLAFGGCDRSSSSSEQDRKREAELKRQGEIDRLRSLGYAGYSETQADTSKQGVILHDRKRSWPGYNLYSNHSLCSAELIDMEGKLVGSWEYAGGHHWSNSELLPNGDLLVVAIGTDPTDSDEPRKGQAPHYILRYSWSGELIWKRMISAHHDIELTPDNRLLTLTLSQRHVPSIRSDGDIVDNPLTLLTQDGAIIESLSMVEMFSAKPTLFTFQNVSAVPEHRRGIDLLHCNSVEWMHHPHLESRHPIYAAHNVLVCSRHQDVIAVMDWDKKELVWAWGQGEISGPHDAHVLDNGNFLLFDNGLGRQWSRVIELDPLAKRIVWEYRAEVPTDFYTMARGSCQRLPNGNTLIAESDDGHAFEVTSDGQIVWEFMSPHLNKEGQRAAIVRMKRYELAYVREIMTAEGIRRLRAD